MCESTTTTTCLYMENGQADAGRTAEPVSRDEILRRVRGQGNSHFPCPADHEQDMQPYPVDPYSATCDDHTYSSKCIYSSIQYPVLCNNGHVPSMLDTNVENSNSKRMDGNHSVGWSIKWMNGVQHRTLILQY